MVRLASSDKLTGADLGSTVGYFWTIIIILPCCLTWLRSPPRRAPCSSGSIPDFCHHSSSCRCLAPCYFVTAVLATHGSVHFQSARRFLCFPALWPLGGHCPCQAHAHLHPATVGWSPARWGMDLAGSGNPACLAADCHLILNSFVLLFIYNF